MALEIPFSCFPKPFPVKGKKIQIHWNYVYLPREIREETVLAVGNKLQWADIKEKG